MESSWSVSKLSTESVGSSRELVANSCSHRRRRRDITVLSCRRRRCVLGITCAVIFPFARWHHVCKKSYFSLTTNESGGAAARWGRGWVTPLGPVEANRGIMGVEPVSVQRGRLERGMTDRQTDRQTDRRSVHYSKGKKVKR